MLLCGKRRVHLFHQPLNESIERLSYLLNKFCGRLFQIRLLYMKNCVLESLFMAHSEILIFYFYIWGKWVPICKMSSNINFSWNIFCHFRIKEYQPIWYFYVHQKRTVSIISRSVYWSCVIISSHNVGFCLTLKILFV